MHPDTITELAALHRSDLDREAARTALASAARAGNHGRSRRPRRIVASPLIRRPLRLAHMALAGLDRRISRLLIVDEAIDAT